MVNSIVPTTEVPVSANPVHVQPPNNAPLPLNPQSSLEVHDVCSGSNPGLGSNSLPSPGFPAVNTRNGSYSSSSQNSDWNPFDPQTRAFRNHGRTGQVFPASHFSRPDIHRPAACIWGSSPTNAFLGLRAAPHGPRWRPSWPSIAGSRQSLWRTWEWRRPSLSGRSICLHFFC